MRQIISTLHLECLRWISSIWMMASVSVSTSMPTTGEVSGSPGIRASTEYLAMLLLYVHSCLRQERQVASSSTAMPGSSILPQSVSTRPDSSTVSWACDRAGGTVGTQAFLRRTIALTTVMSGIVLVDAP